ncbi:BolA family protein [Inhella crocodyli]|uniref:BolA family transcriptional regulator n=1 Tax=Inhella crocodyli TaxID=2499851 RepID=A0A3S2UKP5_9BURK|nr:BolA family protein [Inhella crocodyli]RVT88394.1 BolA family transcriptional regulator [Inhella crocodyli]
MKARLDELGALLTESLGATALAWQDDSHLHAGHAGAREGGHYRLRIVSPRFAGLGRVARHRLIYDALGPLADRGIHALQIDARSPEEP